MRFDLNELLRSAWSIIERYGHLNWALIDQIVISGTNFLTGLLLARHLGVEKFGQFSLAWLTIVVVQSLQQASITDPMISIGSRQSEYPPRSYYAIVFVHALFFAFASTLLVVAGLLASDRVFSHWEIGSLVVPVSIVVIVSQLHEFLRRFYYAINRPHMSFASGAVRNGIQIAVLLWLFLQSDRDTSVAEVFWVILAGAGAGMLFVCFNLDMLEWPTIGWRSVTLRHWNFSKWLAGSTSLSLFSGNIFDIVAAAMTGASTVGILKAAHNVMGVTHVLYMGLNNYLPIHASRSYRQGGIGELQRFIRNAAFMVILITVVFASFVSFYSDQIMGLLYGPQFRDYGWVLVGYAVFYVFIGLDNVIPYGLHTLEKTSSIMVATACAFFVSLIVVYPLISLYGIAGVIIGRTLQQAIRAIIPFVAFRRLVRQIGTT